VAGSPGGEPPRSSGGYSGPPLLASSRTTTTMATRMTTVATAAKSNWIPLNGIAQPLSFADAASIAAEDGSWMSGRRSGAG
jgi:hypothetical protein